MSAVATRTLPMHVWVIDLSRIGVGKVRVAKRYPRGHVVTRPGIRCHGCAGDYCAADATRCEYLGGGFFYYCDRHWITAGTSGSSPRDRAWVAYEGPREAPEKKP